MIFLNVMWKFLGQQSFHLDEQATPAPETRNPEQRLTCECVGTGVSGALAGNRGAVREVGKGSFRILSLQTPAVLLSAPLTVCPSGTGGSPEGGGR
eukprot:725065-Rhodomonas_salina.1